MKQPRVHKPNTTEQMFLAEVSDMFRHMPEAVREGWVADSSIMRRVLADAFDWSCFDVWQELTESKWSQRAEIIADFESDEHITIDPWGYRALEHVTEWGGFRPLKLVRLSQNDLGFAKPVSRHAVKDRALQFGLQLCPLWVGPQLHWIYRPEREEFGYTEIFSEPINVGDGEYSVFAFRSIIGVKKGGTQYNHMWHRFDAVTAKPEDEVSENSQLVFVRPW